jgi:hypothetical protein
MEPRKRKLLDEHLPYELDMLDASFDFVVAQNAILATSDDINEKAKRNLAIEAFWIHARNLIDFLKLNRKPNEGEEGAASAKDFTDASFRSDLQLGELPDRINEQICHLKYERESEPGQKLGGYDMLRVKQAIDREIRRFEQHLTAESRAIWRPRRQLETKRALPHDLILDSTTSTVVKTIGSAG